MRFTEDTGNGYETNVSNKILSVTDEVSFASSNLSMTEFAASFMKEKVARFTSHREAVRNMMSLRLRLGERNTAVCFLWMGRYTTTRN